MMISTKGRYALRVLIDMAEHQTDGYIPLKEIAKRQDISEKYLESIVKSLVKGGVVEGRTTVKARAFYENGEGSAVVTAEYALGRCDDPVISLADGTVFPHSDQAVSITALSSVLFSTASSTLGICVR